MNKSLLGAYYHNINKENMNNFRYMWEICRVCVCVLKETKRYIYRSAAHKSIGDVEMQLHVFLTFALDERDCSALFFGFFKKDKGSPVATYKEAGWAEQLICRESNGASWP